MPSIKKNTTAATIGYEAQLWQMADALRGSMVYSTHRKLTDEKIARIAITYHAWLCDFKLKDEEEAAEEFKT